MISHILFIIVSSVFGIMLFFSFVVAPIGFKSLSEKNFRKFIRTIFPYYYTVNLILLTLVAITIFIYYGFVFDLIPILICIILFVFSLFISNTSLNNFSDFLYSPLENSDRPFSNNSLSVKPSKKISLN